MQFRQWQHILHQEVIFHLHNAVVIPFLIFDDLFKDFWIDSPCIIFKSLIRRKIFRLYDIRLWRYIDFDFFITSQISFFGHFFFGKWIVDEVGCCVVEVEGIDIARKIFSQTSIFSHLREYFVGECESFFFGVLLIEDVELFVFESNTSQAIGTIF